MALGSTERGGLFSWIAVLIGVATGAVTFGHSVFAPVVSDTSGYVAAAHLVREGRLFRPSPHQLIPTIANSGASTEPLGFVAGPSTGTEVPVYPLGSPT